MANWFRRLLGPPRAREEQTETEEDLVLRVRELERWQKDQELVMEEWHGKMRRVLARINRAARVEGEREDDQPRDLAARAMTDHRQLSVFEAKRALGGGT